MTDKTRAEQHAPDTQVFPQLHWRRAERPDLPPPARDGHSLPVFVLFREDGKLVLGGGIYQHVATEEWSVGWWHDGRGSVHADGINDKHSNVVEWWAWSPYELTWPFED